MEYSYQRLDINYIDCQNTDVELNTQGQTFFVSAEELQKAISRLQTNDTKQVLNSAVISAENTSGEEFVFKFINPVNCDDELAKYLVLQEATGLQHLPDNPHILSCLGYGEFYYDDNNKDKPYAYLIFKKITPFEFNTEYNDDQIYNLLQGVALGLDFIHKNNLIHGDIKLDNVGFNKNGLGAILDFATARLISESNLEELPMLLDNFTLEYAAPEVKLRNCIPGITADNYSFAVLAYRLFTGEYPSWSPALNVGNDDNNWGHISEPQKLINCHELPPEVFEVFEKALRFNPEDRYEQNSEFADDLISADMKYRNVEELH